MTLVIVVRDAEGAAAKAETAGLIRELVRQGVGATPATEPAPTGSKSGLALTAGSLVISGALSTTVIRSITQVVLARIRRGAPGQIVLTNGDSTVSFDNPSPETERALTSWLTAQAD